MAVQRGNVAAVLGSLGPAYNNGWYFFTFLHLSSFYLRGYETFPYTYRIRRIWKTIVVTWPVTLQLLFLANVFLLSVQVRRVLIHINIDLDCTFAVLSENCLYDIKYVSIGKGCQWLHTCTYLLWLLYIMHDVIALVCYCSCMSCEKRKVATAVVEVVDQAAVCLYVRENGTRP